jgi:tRNA A37 N6-isopentenylltransferase MiaA
MIETIKKEDWQYAKRQMTWFKKDPRTRWVKTSSQAIKLTQKYLSAFQGSNHRVNAG